MYLIHLQAIYNINKLVPNLLKGAVTFHKDIKLKLKSILTIAAAAAAATTTVQSTANN